MGYYNLIYQSGENNFLQNCKKTGFLVPLKNPKAIAEKIEQLIKNKNYFLSTKYLEKAIIQKKDSHYLFCNLMFCYMNIFKNKEISKIRTININTSTMEFNNSASESLIFSESILSALAPRVLDKISFWLVFKENWLDFYKKRQNFKR